MLANRRNAFTLIELLVVIAIIALLISLILPSLAWARKAGRATVCRAKLSQIGRAQTTYGGDFKDCFPGPSWPARRNGDTTPYPSQYADLATATAKEDWAAGQQIDDIIRTKLAWPEFNEHVYSYIPNVYYSHLVMLDYLDGNPATNAVVCPEDADRLNWRQQYTQDRDHPEKVCTNYPSGNWRWPFSTSYLTQMHTYTYDSWPLTQPVQIQFWLAGARAGDPNQQGIVPRKQFHVVYPSNKVIRFDEGARHAASKTYVYAYPSMWQPLLFADSSVRDKFARDANQGSTTPDSALKVSLFSYDNTNKPWAPRFMGTDVGNDYFACMYMQTRMGLRGIDFGGPPVFPEK